MILDLIGLENNKQVRYENAENTYRKILGVSADEPVTEISEQMLNKIAQENGILHTDDLKEYLLRNCKEEQEVEAPTEEPKELEQKEEEKVEVLNEGGTDVDDPDLADKIEDETGATEEQAEEAAELAKDLDNNTDDDLKVVYIEGDFERELDWCYRIAKKAMIRGEDDKFATNLCVIGDVGSGKTERFKAWCKHYNLGFVCYKADEITIDDIKMLPVGEDPDRPGHAKLTNLGTFEPLEQEAPYVLYIDEYNRCDPMKRTFWFKLIDEHVITDPDNKVSRQKYLPKMLFAVVTINPYVLKSGEQSEDDALTGLTPPELNRLRQHYLTNNNIYNLRYFRQYFIKDTKKHPEEAAENAGRLHIVTELLKSKNFVMVSDDEINQATQLQIPFLTVRSLKTALWGCDGTVANFLDRCEGYIGAKAKKMCATILSDVKDIDDKPNEVWKFWDSYGVKLQKPTESEEEEEEADSGIIRHSTGVDKLHKLKK